MSLIWLKGKLIYSEYYSYNITIGYNIFILLVNTASLKKVKLNIESLHSAKLKEEKALKSGKKSVKGKSVKMDLNKVRYAVALFLLVLLLSKAYLCRVE